MERSCLPSLSLWGYCDPGGMMRQIVKSRFSLCGMVCLKLGRKIELRNSQ